MNNKFFRICEVFTIIGLAGNLMRSVKMPHNKCAQNSIIFVFVLARVTLTIWGLMLVDNIFRLIAFCCKYSWDKKNDPNF